MTEFSQFDSKHSFKRVNDSLFCAMRAKDHDCNAIIYEKARELCTVGTVNKERLTEPVYETKPEKEHFYLEPLTSKAK